MNFYQGILAVWDIEFFSPRNGNPNDGNHWAAGPASSTETSERMVTDEKLVNGDASGPTRVPVLAEKPGRVLRNPHDLTAQDLHNFFQRTNSAQ